MGGVFSNVTSPTTVAKLRILFEVAPLALLIEKAGGASSCDGQQKSGLDVPITEWDQRTQICYGSVGEVKRFEEYVWQCSSLLLSVHYFPLSSAFLTEQLHSHDRLRH